MKNENEKKDPKQDLLIIDAETGLLSHPSTLECVSPNSGILFPNLFGASSERITLYFPLTFVIRTVRSMLLRWAGRVAGVRELRYAYNISIRRCEGQNLFRGRDYNIKMVLKRRSNMRRFGLDLL